MAIKKIEFSQCFYLFLNNEYYFIFYTILNIFELK